MSLLSILVVEDDEGVQSLLRRLLTQEGHQVTIVGNGQDAIRVAQEIPVHVLLTDLKLPDIDGLAVLERIFQIDSKVLGIVMTGYGSIDGAVKAMKLGAFDFLTKPFDNEAVALVINKAMETHRRRQDIRGPRKSVRASYRAEQLVGTSEPVQRVLDFVAKVADHDSTVLIQGESGTGKELVARMLHFNSVRKDRPFVPVNCGAIPENLLESELFGHEKGAFTGAAQTRIGRFELAHGGTIFLDEIGELSLGLQVKLLRVLQERSFERVGGTKTIEVDVRVVAATNQDLEQAVQQKRFRQDLYYRLNVIPITTPSLKERRSDIPQLVNYFMERLNHTKQTAITGCSPDAMTCLMEHQWPGNIRELENMIERLVVLKQSGAIEVSDLPERVFPRPAAAAASAAEPTETHFIGFTDQGVSLSRELEQLENRLIVGALRRANGITSKAAQLLQVNTLYAVGALGAALLAAVVFFLLRRLVIFPLKGLGEAVQQIAQGHYESRAAVSSNDEVGQLSQAFNSMGEKLEAQVAKEREQAAEMKGITNAIDKAQATIELKLDGTVVTANDNFLKTMGYTLSEIQGQHHRMFCDPGYVNSAEYGGFWAKLNRGEFEAGSYLRIGKGGREVWVQASYNPIMDADGKPYKVIEFSTDVTESKKKEIVKYAMDSATNPVLMVDRNMAITYANKSAMDKLRALDSEVRKVNPAFNADKLIGSCIDSFHKNPSTQRRILADPKNMPYKAEIKLGPLTMALTVSAIISEKGEHLGNTLEWADITGQKKAQIELDRLIMAASSGQLGERINAEEFEGFFKTLSQGVNTMLDAVVTPLHEAQQVLTALSQGDLRSQMTGSYEGEFEQMKTSLNAAITNLTATLSTVRIAAESVSTGSEQISKGNEDLSQRTSEQASSLEETSSAMEEMTSAVKQSADNAKQANQLAIAARDVAEKGGAVTTKAIDAMGEINKSSKKIGDIITVIDEIAFQTNLLALNAAVEAARAGEHGRGFAVVAAEVRNLAQRSATAAKEIKGLINESIQRVTDGSELVDQSGKTLAEIVGSVKRVTDIIAEITASAQEQASGIDQVNKAIVQMDETTQQNAALVEEATSASQSMKEQARELMNQVATFKLAQSGQEQSQRPGAVAHKPSASSAGSVKKHPAKKPASAPEPVAVASSNGKDRRSKDGEFEEF